MELNIVKADGSASKDSVNLSDDVFAREFNEALVHQVVTAYLAGARQGTRGFKNRRGVSGGGTKPWRQKGTGRARAGTIRSPLWRGGGKTFTGVTRDYSQKVNKKMRRGAMRAILSELARQQRLLVVDQFGMEAPRTKDLVGKLKSMGLNNVLIVTTGGDDNLFLSARNLAHVDVCTVGQADPVSLVNHEKVLVTVEAAKKFEELLA